MENLNHDLVQQLNIVLKSIWRVGQYQKDAKRCPGCLKLWGTIESRLKGLEKLLTKKIGRHVEMQAFK